VGDEEAINAALEALLARKAPEAIMLGRIAASGRLARRLELARGVQRWAAQERAGRSEDSRAMTRELNSQLRDCFSRVSLAMDSRTVTIAALRQTKGADLPIEVRFDRRDCPRYAPEGRRCRLHRWWSEREIVDALREWAEEHGRSPKLADWHFSDPSRPTSHTVRRRLGSWNKALRRAGLEPAPRVSHYQSRAQEIHRERAPGRKTSRTC
jgi:hypothetical protein